jgi:hypothetical protein
MRVKLGNWAGGGPGQSKGTVEWAGGDVDFSKGPFKMYAREVSITNNNPACSYEYGDRSGSYESIKVISTGDSCSAQGGSNSTSSASSSSSATKTGSGSEETESPSSISDMSSVVTVAPTDSHVVAPIEQTITLSSTVVGSAYSTNVASASALNEGNTNAPTAAASGDGADSPSATSSSEVETSTGAASANTVLTAGSFIGVAIGFFML